MNFGFCPNNLTLQWLCSIAIEDVVIFFIKVIVLGGAYKFLEAIYISRKILKRNRCTHGNGRGLHWADRYIEVYMSNEKERCIYNIKDMFTAGPCTIQSATWQYVIDDGLKKLKLVEIDEIHGRKIVVLKRSFRNFLVVYISMAYLIFFIGDNKSFYKELYKRKKR